MKTKFLFLFVFLSKLAYCQTPPNPIDSSNYYENFTKTGSINWLRISDAVPIVIDELQKNGYSYAFIEVGKLMRVGNGQYFVISVSYDKEKSFGFIYKQGHGLPFYKSDRFFMNREDESEFQYVQSESDNDTSTNYIQIKRLPMNIFILDERCYWYEFDPKGKKQYPVSREIASEILRADIRAYLNKVK